MTGPVAAVLVVELGAAVSGAVLAWRRREHWPLAGLFTLGALVDIGLELHLPFAGRVVLGTVYPWAALAVVARVLGRWSRRRAAQDALLGGFACYVAALFALGLRGPALAHAYAAAQVGIASGMGWAVLAWRARTLRIVTPTVAGALIVAAAEVACAGGPYLDPDAKWYLARVAYFFAFGALTLIQIGAMRGWMRWTSSSGPGPGSSSLGSRRSRPPGS